MHCSNTRSIDKNLIPLAPFYHFGITRYHLHTGSIASFFNGR